MRKWRYFEEAYCSFTWDAPLVFGQSLFPNLVWEILFYLFFMNQLEKISRTQPLKRLSLKKTLFSLLRTLLKRFLCHAAVGLPSWNWKGFRLWVNYFLKKNLVLKHGIRIFHSVEANYFCLQPATDLLLSSGLGLAVYKVWEHYRGRVVPPYLISQEKKMMFDPIKEHRLISGSFLSFSLFLLL